MAHSGKMACFSYVFLAHIGAYFRHMFWGLFSTYCPLINLCFTSLPLLVFSFPQEISLQKRKAWTEKHGHTKILSFTLHREHRHKSVWAVGDISRQMPGILRYFVAFFSRVVVGMGCSRYMCDKHFQIDFWKTSHLYDQLAKEALGRG